MNFVNTLYHWNDLVSIYPWLPWLMASILGLVFGSFIGCVAYRLPVMLENMWQQAAGDILDVPQTVERFNLVYPRSFCPQCRHTIGVPYLIPLLGYFFSLAKCRHCRKSIPILYPVLEVATALVFCWVYAIFGFSVLVVPALVYCLGLILLTLIDGKRQLLPDIVVLPLLWLGLVINYFDTFVPFSDSFWGSVVGYTFFWLLYWVFLVLTGKESLGRGDMKLLAMLGAWSGALSLPGIVFFSAIAGLLWLLARVALKRGSIREPMAFGPFLIFGGWLSLLYGGDWFIDTGLFVTVWQQLFFL